MCIVTEGQIGGCHWEAMIRWWKKWKTTGGTGTEHHPSGRPDYDQEQLRYPPAPRRSEVTVWPIFEHNQGYNRDISHILMSPKAFGLEKHMWDMVLFYHFAPRRRGQEIGSKISRKQWGIWKIKRPAVARKSKGKRAKASMGDESRC